MSPSVGSPVLGGQKPLCLHAVMVVHHKLTCLNWSLACPGVLGGYETFKRWDLAGRGGSPKAGLGGLQTNSISSLISTTGTIKMRTSAVGPSPRDQVTPSLSDLDGLMALETMSQTILSFPEVASFWL